MIVILNILKGYAGGGKVLLAIPALQRFVFADREKAAVLDDFWIVLACVFFR